MFAIVLPSIIVIVLPAIASLLGGAIAASLRRPRVRTGVLAAQPAPQP